MKRLKTAMTLLFGVLIFFTTTLSLAQDWNAPPFSNDGHWLDPNNELSAYLNHLVKQRSSKTFSSQTSSSSSRHCTSKYKKILKDQKMVINLTFGYSDSYGQTLDSEMHQKTYEALVRPCPSKQHEICRFKLVQSQNNDQVRVLQKSVLIPPHSFLNPTSQKKKIIIKVKIAHSSHQNKDQKNLDSLGFPSQTQKKYTQWAEQNFFDSIEGRQTDACDICIYYGHARDGGGPDFSPVPQPWRTEEGKPNYNLYQKYKYNYSKLISALLNNHKQPPTVVGVFACYSHLHFWKHTTCPYEHPNCKSKYNLKHFSKKTEFILTPRFSQFFNWHKTLGILLDQSIGFRCNEYLLQNYQDLNELPLSHKNTAYQSNQNTHDNEVNFLEVFSKQKEHISHPLSAEDDPTEHYSIYGKPQF